MDCEKTNESCQLWVDEKNQIISFRYEEDFTQYNFSGRDEMLRYVLMRCEVGCRVQ